MVHLYKQNGIDVEMVIVNELVIKIEIYILRKERCIIYILHTITITTTTNTPIKIETLLMISNGWNEIKLN